MKTISEIEDLKASWENDPHWDIEDTDGFKDHEEELLAYRKQKESEWDQKSEQRTKDKAIALGCPENLLLARYIMALESRIEDLDAMIEKMENV